MTRPPFITNIHHTPRNPMRIARTGEELGLAAMLGTDAGLKTLRSQHEILPPGRRSASPHAHTHTEEIVFILDGTPDLWVDGTLYPLEPGDCVSFAPGTGITHTVINNSARNAVLLAIAAVAPEDACFYPHKAAADLPAGIPAEWVERPRGDENALPIAPTGTAQASGA